MKKLLLLICVLLATNVYAKIIRVNNQEPTNPQQSTYASLQDAYDNAQAGDTLYIEGSTTDYGFLEVTKRLTFIGPGYFLAENIGTQVNVQPAVIRRIEFLSGSEGSKVIGLTIYYVNTGYILIDADNIEITKTHFLNNAYINIARGTFDNISIRQNYFLTQPIKWGQFTHLFQNLFFANNIVLGEFKLQNNTTGTIVNNVFVNSTFDVGANSVLNIHNNILLGTNTSEVVLPAPQSSITHNIAALNQFGTNNNNQANVAPTNIFIGGESPDGQYQIKENGPADNTGRSGVDIGAFGGPEPYRLSGIPNIPHIYELTTDGFATEGGELKVQIKVSAN